MKRLSIVFSLLAIATAAMPAAASASDAGTCNASDVSILGLRLIHC
jgi:hypothetical protein